jgi:hypothetical protein
VTDHLAVARACIAASASAPSDELAAYYCACARAALGRLKEETKSTAVLVLAREEELVRRAAPKAQLVIAEEEGKT